VIGCRNGSADGTSANVCGEFPDAHIGELDADLAFSGAVSR
jgi:hypothetical protein